MFEWYERIAIHETRNAKSKMKVATYSKEYQCTLHSHEINAHSVPNFQSILEQTTKCPTQKLVETSV